MHISARRSLLAAAAGSFALALSLVGAPAAQAQTVRHVDFSFPVQDTITDLCPFPIDLSGTISGHVQDFRDDAGNFVRVALHFDNRFALSANGTTLIERDHFTEFDLNFAGQGAPSRIVNVGNWTNIRVPSGQAVAIEAGRITEDLQTGEVTMTGHFQLSNGGDTAQFCSAF